MEQLMIAIALLCQAHTDTTMLATFSQRKCEKRLVICVQKSTFYSGQALLNCVAEGAME